MSVQTLETSGKFDSVYVQADVDEVGTAALIPAPLTVYAILVDNNQTGTPTAVYLKLYDSAAPVFGTTQPTEIFLIPASVAVVIPFNLPNGKKYRSGFSVACSKTAGAPNTAAPDTTVTIKVFKGP